MSSAGSQSAAGWLAENGPRELELLFRAVIYHPSELIVITDDDGNSQDASVGVGKFLGLRMAELVVATGVPFVASLAWRKPRMEPNE